MKYVIVGVPGSGKPGVAEKLQEKVKIGATSGRFPGDDIPVGFLADYRTELFLASARAIFLSDNIILWHSLIDSLGYATLRLTSMLNEDPRNPQVATWALTFDAIMLMTLDGYNADLTLYIPYEGDDQDLKDLDEAFRATLDTLPIKHQVIDPEAEVDTWISN